MLIFYISRQIGSVNKSILGKGVINASKNLYMILYVGTIFLVVNYSYKRGKEEIMYKDRMYIFSF